MQSALMLAVAGGLAANSPTANTLAADPLAAHPLPGAGPAQELDRAWVLVREDLDLTIDPKGTLHLEGTLVARLEHADSSDGPILAMNARDPLMAFGEVDAGGASVELNTSHEDMGEATLAVVRYDEPKSRGDEVTISFRCESERNGRQFVIADSIAFASWVEAWYPIVPPQRGTSMGGATKVAGSTTFRLPPGWHAVTNGGLISSEASASGTVEVWESERALSRSFAAGPYTKMREQVGDLDVSLYLLSDDVPDPRAHVESLSIAIEAMEERWGPYPYPSYAIAEVPHARGSFGASSEQGFIMVKPNYLQTEEGNLPLFAHEASHAWWGNTVGADGAGSLLCTESLAQYGAVIAAERLWGEEGATEFLRFSRPGYIPNQCARGYFAVWSEGRDKPMSQLVSGGDPDHMLSDAKGHWVYHMLRRRVGDELFFATQRELIDEYTARTMTLDDVRAKFIEAAPDAGLETFFAQWLDRTGAPVLLHEWDEDGGTVSLTVGQMQEGEPYELWLDVGLRSGSELRVERVRLSERQQTFEIAGAADVDEVVLDPHHALLLWNPEYGDCPVPGLAGLAPAPLSSDEMGVYMGRFEVAEVGATVMVSGETGRLMMSLAGRPAEALIRTGGHRFRSNDGFVIFDVVEGRAERFLYVRDAGGSRRAVRRE